MSNEPMRWLEAFATRLGEDVRIDVEPDYETPLRIRVTRWTTDGTGTALAPELTGELIGIKLVPSSGAETNKGLSDELRRLIHKAGY